MARSHWTFGLLFGVGVAIALRVGLPAWLTIQVDLARHPVWAGWLPMLDRGLTGVAILACGVCWFAAYRSWRTRSAQRALLDTQTGLDSLRALSWQDFERLVAEAYRRQGYTVIETGGGGKDGGIDLLLRKRLRTIMVQCKHWKSTRVSAPVVREMWGLRTHHGYHGVKIVSIGEFTPDAAAFAQGKPLELVNGAALWALVRSVQRTPPSSVVACSGEIASSKRLCPRCRSSMVRRQHHASGDRFWGCSAYPRCRGTRPIVTGQK